MQELPAFLVLMWRFSSQITFVKTFTKLSATVARRFSSL